MPAAFTASERERIGGLLRAAGRRLFTTQGLRKTSIDELVAPAGIVKSTFYVFHDSKEALYLELILEGNERVRRRTIDEALNQGTDVRDSLRRYLRAVVDVLAEDPLYHRLITHPEELAAVAAKLDTTALERAQDNGIGELTAFVSGAQRAGRLPGSRPEVVVGVLRAVLLLTQHAEEFGDTYAPVLDLLLDSVTTGLTAPQPAADGSARKTTTQKAKGRQK